MIQKKQVFFRPLYAYFDSKFNSINSFSFIRQPFLTTILTTIYTTPKYLKNTVKWTQK